MVNVFSRSWEITKMTVNVIKQDKELLLFPILSGIFSLAFIVAMILPTIMSLMVSQTSRVAITSTQIIIFFGVYFGLAFIATFFNVCVVNTSKIRFEGKNATFMDSIRFAFSKIHLIFMWSLVSASVGILLRMLDNMAQKSRGIPRMIMAGIISMIGLAWSVVTLFVIPAMVYHNLGPIDAIKKSVHTIKKTWGESLIRHYGLGFAQGIFIIAGIVIGVIAVFLFSTTPILMLIVLGIVVLYILGVMLFFSVANSVFNTALYAYANSGKIPKEYRKEIFEHAFSVVRKD